MDTIGKHADTNSFIFLAMILIPYYAGLLSFIVFITKTLGSACFDEFPFDVVFPVAYSTVTVVLAITVFGGSNRTKILALRTSVGFHTLSFIALVCVIMQNWSVINVGLGTVALTGFLFIQIYNVGQVKIS
ncbi:hypothetical protein SUGI_0129570 [Cryptomeria japonica]|nr:hypothetical protein SUGI_0129550 [Cryptomeria japonica]GLJ10510.1 hypothetical protein SUGI_0129560 [Cryptomeria japonica]GLJ10511.1 hypothetical protein SUGI_0129570 [Cryptomeria japonica]